MGNQYTGIADCWEVPETATEDYDDENGLMSASVTLRCAYSDRHSVAGDVCSNRRPWPKGSYGLVPKASRASIKAEMNVGTVDGQVWYPTTALVTLYYTTRTADIITESVEPTMQSVTLDYQQFCWGSGFGRVLTPEQAPGYLIRGINFVRTSYYVQPPLDPNLTALVGHCNAAPFTSTLLGGLFFDTQTLLFAAPVINRKINSNGVQQFDITKRWNWQPQGWNQWYHHEDDTWEQLYVRGSSSPYLPVPVSDMTSLLSN